MKKMSILACAAAMICSCSSSAQKQEENTEENAPKVLVAYFSQTGTTENVAKAIADTTSATLYAITAETPYTEADLDWRNDKSRSSVEMTDSTSRPALGGDKVDVAEYDVVFLGYPIWWDQCPRVVNTWIESQPALKGKPVYTFATSGSSSIDNSVKVLKRLYPEIDWKESKLLNEGAKAASDWAAGLNIK